jgi:uncharacterized protein YcaQ
MARLDGRPLERLSAEEARGVLLRAQGLDATPAHGSVDVMLSQLGAVQLDTISTLARSHELVAYARLGPVPRKAIEAAYWSEPAGAFEYIGHAGCIMPLQLWPYFAFRRRALRERDRDLVQSEVLEAVREQLRQGSVTTTDLGGAREGPRIWWNWSDAKTAVELLVRWGEAAVTRRQAWKRIYDLPGRFLPGDLLAAEPSDEECYARLVEVAARALGVATARDLADYFNLTTPYAGAVANSRRLVLESIEAAGLTPVQVEGWPDTAYVHPAALDASYDKPQRTTLLSPFDSLIWATAQPGQSRERERPRRIFDFSLSFEAYVPRAQRVHGYFVMPLLTQGHLAGRVDPKRDGSTLVAANLSLEDGDDLEAMATALIEAAAWVGCTSIRVDRMEPAKLIEPLRRLVA